MYRVLFSTLCIAFITCSLAATAGPLDHDLIELSKCIQEKRYQDVCSKVQSFCNDDDLTSEQLAAVYFQTHDVGAELYNLRLDKEADCLLTANIKMATKLSRTKDLPNELRMLADVKLAAKDHASARQLLQRELELEKKQHFPYLSTLTKLASTDKALSLNDEAEKYLAELKTVKFGSKSMRIQPVYGDILSPTMTRSRWH